MPPLDPRTAFGLLQQGRWAEAEAAYRTLLDAQPSAAGLWFNLAVAQRMAGKFEAALAAYECAIGLGVREPEEAHVNRSVILMDHLRRDADAERELEAALGKNPRYLPALLNLGNLKEDQGKRTEALALYDRALAIEPANAIALSRAAPLRPAHGLGDPILRELEHAVALHASQPAEAAMLGFALGKALDERGAYDRAFEAYAQANTASRASAGARYDRARAEAFTDALIAAFPGRGAIAPGGKAPVFICGMFRSGSTLVEQILASHPMVEAGGELPFIPGFAAKELAPYPASMARVDAERLATLAERYRAEIATRFPRAGIVTDKRPDNFLHIGLIKRLFPDARIVHTTRQPLDNCLSIFFLHLDHRMSYALDLGDIGHHYAQYRRLMAHWKALHAGDILDVSYDALVREPRPTIERLLAFCGLPWDDACLSFHTRAGAVKTASVWQVREPLYDRSSGRWRHYEKHLAPLREALGDIASES